MAINTGRPPRGGAWIEIMVSIPSSTLPDVAPLAGGRGLNFPVGTESSNLNGSPPSRGGRGLKSAWMSWPPTSSCRPPRGGRGLKYTFLRRAIEMMTSPPSRGAWIEIAAHTAPRRSRPSPLRPVCPPGAPSCRPAKSSFVPSVVMYPVSFQLFVSPKNSFADFTWPFFSASE